MIIYRYADAATILLRWALAADKCNATHSQCKAYLSAIIVYLYAHDFKEAEKCYNDCCQVETFLNSDQSRCASKFLSAYREGDEEEIKRVGQSSIVTNLDHTKHYGMVVGFCFSCFLTVMQILTVIITNCLMLLDAAPDSGVLEMQLESHLVKSEGQDALQGDQQFTLAERMAKALAVMKCLDWNFLVVNGDIMAIPGLYKLVHGNSMLILISSGVIYIKTKAVQMQKT
nr:gamma-soluble NSF attachment protein [Ipomoea batatas]